MFTLRPHCITDIDPHLPPTALRTVADELDRRAGIELAHGRFLWAERASTRAEQLREMAGVAR